MPQLNFVQKFQTFAQKFQTFAPPMPSPLFSAYEMKNFHNMYHYQNHHKIIFLSLSEVP